MKRFTKLLFWVVVAACIVLAVAGAMVPFLCCGLPGLYFAIRLKCWHDPAFNRWTVESLRAAADSLENHDYEP